MLARNCGWLAAVVVAVVAFGSPAYADSVQFTFEGTATPYWIEGIVNGQEFPCPESFGLPETEIGDCFDITLTLCIDVASVCSTTSDVPYLGTVESLVAEGSVLWWGVEADGWSDQFVAADMLAGFDDQLNFAGATINVATDPEPPIPLLVGGTADVAGLNLFYDDPPNDLCPVGGEGFAATLLAGLVPFTDTVGAVGSMSRFGFETIGPCSYAYFEEGFFFCGELTDVGCCECIIPEPASLSLLALGIGAIVARRARKRSLA
ncbi:MAG: PEP-CTERM sorting domain-containing protein [bacterium]|nr:PEP-CTERM sorting domain-containing protein [bacterium]